MVCVGIGPISSLSFRTFILITAKNILDRNVANSKNLNLTIRTLITAALFSILNRDTEI